MILSGHITQHIFLAAKGSDLLGCSQVVELGGVPLFIYHLTYGDAQGVAAAAGNLATLAASNQAFRMVRELGRGLVNIKCLMSPSLPG